MKLKLEHSIFIDGELRTSCERFRAGHVNWVRYVNPRGENFYVAKAEWDGWLDACRSRGTISEVPYVWSDTKLTVLFQNEDGSIGCNAYGNDQKMSDEDRQMRNYPERSWLEFFRQSTARSLSIGVV